MAQAVAGRTRLPPLILVTAGVDRGCRGYSALTTAAMRCGNTLDFDILAFEYSWTITTIETGPA